MTATPNTIHGSGVWLDRSWLWLLLAALVLRLAFWLPYYIPIDTLDYLTSFQVFASPHLIGSNLISDGESPDRLTISDTIHMVRLGMTIPLGVIRWISDYHPLTTLYPLLCSLGVVFLTYRLGCMWAGDRGGLVAGVIVAAIPVEMVYATLALPDTPLDFFGLLALWLLIGEARDRHTATGVSVVLAGMCIGVGYTCKVTALFFMVPAVVQAFFIGRRVREPLLLIAGLAAVLALEIVYLWSLMGEPHLRIVETLGFIPGTKGNYMHVDRTLVWWMEQIWFKVGALLWASHPPTAVLYVFTPHLTLYALWRLHRRDALPEGAIWVLAWGGTWLAQQLLLSSIEQGPRYFQVVSPYMALTIGIALTKSWTSWRPSLRRGVAALYVIASVAAATIFKITFSPGGEASEWVLDTLEEERRGNSEILVGSSSFYAHRLVYYRRLDTVIDKPGKPTHWVVYKNGYTWNDAQRDDVPSHLSLWKIRRFESSLQFVFDLMRYTPGVGRTTLVEIYRE